ncbi:hypothetical protein CSOJ01_04335 [Colletotrichum sojae]|uniref:Uncharacterized protein n=1 Tax=Colletotrichum sojae TaxID=2175907 RepID=A0A8H6JIP7_9PEZI|nr:hypothetical protein CSOJ01_04335 [Colletotrichum sojae]
MGNGGRQNGLRRVARYLSASPGAERNGDHWRERNGRRKQNNAAHTTDGLHPRRHDSATVPLGYSAGSAGRIQQERRGSSLAP